MIETTELVRTAACRAWAVTIQDSKAQIPIWKV